MFTAISSLPTNAESVKCLNFGLIFYWFIPLLHFHSWLLSVALGYTRSKTPADFIKNDMGCETTILLLISFTQMKYFSSCETYLFLFLHFLHFSQIYLMPNSKTVLTALPVTQFTQFSLCLCPSVFIHEQSNIRVTPAFSFWLNKCFHLLA